jgi:hypothetical protein
MLDQDGHEPLHGTENGAVDHDRSLGLWLERSLFPFERSAGVLIWLEQLGLHFFFLSLSLLIRRVLQVESDWQLEV